MAREHRHLENGEITITPFSPEEEAIADQLEAELLTSTTFYNSNSERIKRVTEGSDLNIIIFKMIFKLHNRVLTLESKPTITVLEFLTFLEQQLTSPIVKIGG